MPFNIFRLNWILIDVILIFFLILFLIGVKIFKGLSRWRYSLSNESLIRSNYKTILQFNYNRTIIKIKNLNLIENSKLKEQALARPSIIIIRTIRKKKITKILTEGLSSYGFNVINIYIKKIHETYLIEENKRNIEKFGTMIMKIFANNNKILNSKYVLINYGKCFLSFNFFLSDIHSTGLFLINPRINESNVKNILALKDLNLSKKHLKIIFSARSKLFLKNLNLKRFKTKIFPYNKDLFKFMIIEASGSFKYYETILLSKIIFLIEKMNNNFQKK
ncbi:MAG: hypothetical protein ACFFD5_01400 [Candidatus Thorarchaeota archaeon]